MQIRFGGYSFQFWLLTTGNRYDAAGVEVSETADGVVARANGLTFGDGTGTSPGRIEVAFERRARGVAWTARASHTEPIKGVLVAVRPLPVGRVLVPLAHDVTIGEGDPGRAFVYPMGYYPLRHYANTGVEPAAGPLPTWATQFALFRGEGRDLFLHAREYPPRVKKLWVYRRGDHQEVRLYTEADAFRRDATYVAPTWFLDEVPDWRGAVDDHAAWYVEAFGVRPLAERADARPWLADVGLTVILHGRSHDGKILHDFAAMTRRLEELSRLYPPTRTIVKLVGFEGRVDHHWPDNDPDPVLGGDAGFAAFMDAARRHGCHVMPHLNLWSMRYDFPLAPELLHDQIRDQEGRPMGWAFDYDQDEVMEEVFAYISPDAPSWRRVQGEKIRGFVERFGPDTIFLDQVGTFVNDRRHDHFRGLRSIYAELREALPTVQFTGEGPTSEVSASVIPLLSGIGGGQTAELAEIYRRFFGPIVREHGHSGSLPPEPYRGVWWVSGEGWWSKDRFLAQEERAERVGAIPTLNLTDAAIRLDGDRSCLVLERARGRGA